MTKNEIMDIFSELGTIDGNLGIMIEEATQISIRVSNLQDKKQNLMTKIRFELEKHAESEKKD